MEYVDATDFIEIMRLVDYWFEEPPTAALLAGRYGYKGHKKAVKKERIMSTKPTNTIALKSWVEQLPPDLQAELYPNGVQTANVSAMEIEEVYAEQLKGMDENTRERFLARHRK